MKKVEAEVVGKKEYKVRGQMRYALKGKTADGRSLTKFVSKVDYEAAAEMPAAK